MTGTTRSTANTGRLVTALSETAQRILFGSGAPDGPDPLVTEMRDLTEVDRAHLVMLTGKGIIEPSQARSLLTAIESLRRADYASLRDRPAPRGRYLSYESYLIDTLGADVGGVLHTGRSRNDLNATTTRLRARPLYTALIDEVQQLAAELRTRAVKYRRTTMPAYTHRQPAVPITYGHYLMGVGNSIARGLAGLVLAGEEMDVNPLGAGAVGGTSVAIDQQRTTRLLGFARTATNSLDAVASRDFVLRLLSEAAMLGVLLARVAQDISLWSTEEFGLVRVPDDLVGSSSMMPQKRNPFVLEHVQGKATAAMGAFVAAGSSMYTSGYTNAIAVGTEAVSHLWPALRSTTEAVVLLRLVIAGTEPVADRMTQRAEQGYTSATQLAEHLVASGMPFRTAHHEVGRTVLRGLETGEPLDVVARDIAGSASLRQGQLDPAAVAEVSDFGGGPGQSSFDNALSTLDSDLAVSAERFAERQRRWAAASAELEHEVHCLIGDRPEWR